MHLIDIAILYCTVCLVTSSIIHKPITSLVSVNGLSQFKFFLHTNLTLKCVFLKFLFIYLFLERKGGRERGTETSMCGCLSLAPYWGPGLQPRHVPWLGNKPVTLWFTSPCSIHWATPARAEMSFYFNIVYR